MRYAVNMKFDYDFFPTCAAVWRSKHQAVVFAHILRLLVRLQDLCEAVDITFMITKLSKTTHSTLCLQPPA